MAKPWYASKTIWAGILMILGGIGVIMNSGDPAQAMQLLLTGFGLIGLRTANEMVE